MTVMEFGYLILISLFFFLQFYFTIFSLALVLTEKIRQTLRTVIDHISKHLEVPQILFCYVLYFQLSSGCLEMWSNTVFVFNILMYYCNKLFVPQCK